MATAYQRTTKFQPPDCGEDIVDRYWLIVEKNGIRFGRGARYL